MSTTRAAAALTCYFRENPRVFLLDGGTGEELFRRGVPDDRKLWSATALVHQEHHSTLQTVHESFLEVGADAITTNSYGCVPGVLGMTESEKVARLCELAARIARQAATATEQLVKSKRIASNPLSKPMPTPFSQSTSQTQPFFVLGSLGPLVESYRSDLVLPHDDGVTWYKRMIQAMLPFVDAFVVETMSSTAEAFQAMEALSMAAAPHHVPCFVSFSLQPHGLLWSGESACQAVQRLVRYSQDDKNMALLGILFNCATPEAITKAVTDIRRDAALCDLLTAYQIRLGAYANRLTPVAVQWSLIESEGPQDMRTDVDANQYYQEFVRHWVEDLGIGIVGGCCGITPEHIAVLKEQLHKE